MNSLKQRLLNGAFWSLLGAVTGRGFVLLAFMLVARIIGKYAYGELGIIRSTINLFTVVSGMGIGYTASKYIAQYRDSDSVNAANIYMLSNFISVCTGIIGSAVLILSASYIAEYSLKNPCLEIDIQIGAIVLLFTTINGAQSGALSGFEAFKKIAINTFISSLIQGILLIILCSYYGVSGCVLALGIGCMCLSILNNRSIKAELNNRNMIPSLRSVKRDSLNILWKFTIPALLSSIVIIPVLWWAKTFLVSNVGYEEMAIFDVADQWSIMVLFIPCTLAQIILPLLSNIMVGGTQKQYLKLVRVNLLLNFVISSCVAFLIVICGPFILSLYGKDFVQTGPLYLMMIASVLISICNVVGSVIASKDKMWAGLGFNMVWAVWIILFTVMFKDLGAKGLALAIVLSYTLHFIAQFLYICNILKSRI
ncbi:oligosaccharide flippase family protein [Parabacteroides distasonis]|uniref:Oligosaccharide flippase family protein n=1 Tax=Parabacteroides distasonis TaxID=823 RepID=A0A5C6KI19_PARDI|nr:oligosaccharide flippase family protein [Parabacteroides distasonis]TWV61371.1 oligosaccharide flippase family protein [Parabacteroides distasonis]